VGIKFILDDIISLIFVVKSSGLIGKEEVIDFLFFNEDLFEIFEGVKFFILVIGLGSETVFTLKEAILEWKRVVSEE